MFHIRTVYHIRHLSPTILLKCVSGDYIKDKYDGATEVRVNRRGRLQIKDPRFNKPTANDLVYIDDSPNYCIRNISVGSLVKMERYAQDGRNGTTSSVNPWTLH
ncbi:hypothetical protein C0J52_21726 [Blattella germanica]|nr:hypothetical protein C0J52_21726 [Blattella germanica]